MSRARASLIVAPPARFAHATPLAAWLARQTVEQARMEGRATRMTDGRTRIAGRPGWCADQAARLAGAGAPAGTVTARI